MVEIPKGVSRRNGMYVKDIVVKGTTDNLPATCKNVDSNQDH